MIEFLSLILATALVNNVALVQLTGVSSLFAYSGQLRQALELALFSLVVMIPALLLASLLDRLLLAPLSLAFLRLPCFLVISGALTTALVMTIKKHLPLSAGRQQLPLLLVGGNSAIIGSALVLSNSSLSLLQTLGYSVGTGLGFAFLLLAFAAFRLRLENSAVPEVFRGPAIQLISAGLISMSLLAMAGSS